jgi:tetratricopeptide (TPR) repeat protein
VGHVQYKKIENFEAEKDYILEALGLTPSSKTRDAKDNAGVSIAGPPTASGALIGRDGELAMLQTAWASTAPGADPTQKTNIVVLHAVGGAGKTALMRHFVDGLADTDFAGAYKVFGWSAYSQGSGDNCNANADEFIARALNFFGHNLARDPIQDPVERGRKLAHLVGERRSLLILDGLEPLQDLHLVNGGRLKDRGLAAVIKELAARNKGLVVITSRQELPELAASKNPRVISHALDRLDKRAGVELLAYLGVHGKRSEMEAAVEDVLGQALALNLLGTYLDAVYGGDVNQREQFKLGEIEDSPADFIGDQTARFAKRAAKIMEGTIARFEELEGRATGGAETAILHIIGLFDRPAEKEGLDALLAEPPIPSLTDTFHTMPLQRRRARWAVAVDRLRKLRLLNAEDPREPGSLDTHPIVRAHFGSRLQHCTPEAFREAHSRLYDFCRYKGLPPEFRNSIAYAALAVVASFPQDREGNRRALADGRDPGGDIPETLHTAPPESRRKAAALIETAALREALRKFLPADLNGMRPCFSAIAHGAFAGRHQEAYSEVYLPRVLRGNEAYIQRKIGAPNAGLTALFSFFEAAWSTPANGLRKETRSRVIYYAAFTLRALGRLREAVEPFEASLRAAVTEDHLTNAAVAASSVSELRLNLGDIREAVAAARISIAHADKSGDPGWRVMARAVLANALYQAGQMRKASKMFKKAESMQAAILGQPPKLYSLQGCEYCDLLLAKGLAGVVVERALDNLDVHNKTGLGSLLTSAMGHLSLGCAYASLRANDPFAGPTRVSFRPNYNEVDGSDSNEASARRHLDTAVEGLRRVETEHYLPRGLLARAAFRRAIGAFKDAAVDLDEAYDIAVRGEMRLYLTDYHLESARLRLAQLSAESKAEEAQDLPARAKEHYTEAKKLIEETGYKRRLPELEAIRACLDGEIPASILDPDRDRHGRPAAEQH